MDPDLEWVITEVDGKISAVSATFGLAAEIVRKVNENMDGKVRKITCTRISSENLLALSERTEWEDLLLFGTSFQKKVWKHLFDLTHAHGNELKLYSYSDFAGICGEKAGVRAVAHAVALNPVAVIIPCHLIIPKEAMDRISAMSQQNILFKSKLMLVSDDKINFGEYAYGAELKRKIIRLHFEEE